MSVESTVGVGSTFCLRLPLKAGGAASETGMGTFFLKCLSIGNACETASGLRAKPQADGVRNRQQVASFPGNSVC